MMICRDVSPVYACFWSTIMFKIVTGFLVYYVLYVLQTQEYELMPGGKDIQVTEANKHKYIE